MVISRPRAPLDARAPEAIAPRCNVTAEPVSGRGCWCSASHPPVAVRAPGGDVRFLEVGLVPLLGAPVDGTTAQAEDRLEPGSVVLLYTDGLVERRRESLEVGLDRLASVLADGPGDLERLGDHLLDALVGDQTVTDDVALILTRIPRAAA